MNAFQKLLFPPRCAACRCLLPLMGEGGETALCRDCRGNWEREKLRKCQECGKMMLYCRCMPDMVRNAGCAGLVRMAAYEPARRNSTVNDAVNNLKRIKSREAFAFFASQLIMPITGRLDEFELDMSDMLVTYCPRRRAARHKNGFDQAEQLARYIAVLGGAHFAVLLERRHIICDREQKRLSAAQRYENPSRALRLTKAVKHLSGERVILVDDIVTTGATFSACAGILRDAGVQLTFGAAIAASIKR